MLQYKEVFQLAQDKGYKHPLTEKGWYSTFGHETNYLHLQLADIQKWLRDEHKIDVLIQHEHFTKVKTIRYNYLLVFGSEENDKEQSEAFFRTYEDALLRGINEALKLI